MYIRRKVFSVLDTEAGERLFSTTDYILDQREFGKDNRKKGDSRKRRTKLEDVQSHRGLGRSIILGDIRGALGGYVGKKYANDLDEQGASDAEIKEKSSKRAAIVGAGLGAASGLATAPYVQGAAGKVLVPVGAAAMSGLGAYLGARKNAEVRLAKRREMDRDRD